jgi:transaldolase/glucose-6-phosphate isomerase
MEFTLSPAAQQAVQKALVAWDHDGNTGKLWDRDASLWTNQDESKWMDWLPIVSQQISHQRDLLKFAEDVRKEGFQHVVLLGMGGSSLCPEVLRLTFGVLPGFPEMHVLDSTDPAQIRELRGKIDPAKTLFIVSSKSGGTLEPNIFKQYFFAEAHGNGAQFVTVTDPGSKMEGVAKQDHFLKIFPGVPGIGGRYSALSHFGTVPAAAMGLDVPKFLAIAQKMVDACGPDFKAAENPGVYLGVILGTLAVTEKRDKITLIASPAIADLGAWLEQLIAESTGKEGHGLIPVDREPLGAPEVYGADRVFIYERFTLEPDPLQEKAVAVLEAAGQPVIRIEVKDRYNLGQEFFRWEIATAVAGSIIGINPFNQPDVEASKIVTKQLTTEYEEKGSLPAEKPFFEAEGMKLYSDPINTTALTHGDLSLSSILNTHLNRLQPGDYFALLGYLQMNAENEAELQKMRMAIRDSFQVATCLGFGPRFLHSTGQAYKGGPNSGVFLQITHDEANDLAVPGQKYTFGVVKAAQARGDFEVLVERKRRALRVHLGPDVRSGLKQLAKAMGVE